MRTTIFASFHDHEIARKAAGALLDHGAKREDISLVLPGAESGEDALDSANSGITTTTSADASKGATTGAGIGLGVGALAALAAILVPGVGLVAGGGALAIALGGAAATTAAGAIAGGTTGYLKDQGVPDDYAKRVDTTITGGGALLSISVPSGELDHLAATELLAKYGEDNYESWVQSAEPVGAGTRSPA